MAHIHNDTHDIHGVFDRLTGPENGMENKIENEMGNSMENGMGNGNENEMLCTG